MLLDAREEYPQGLNAAIRTAARRGPVEVYGVCGQRYLGAGLEEGQVGITGTPGSALGVYLCGGRLFVHGNAQDAVGDTMDGGRIAVDGMVGDAAGYAMRGGEIYVRGSAGYRAGVHMKAYGTKQPVLVIGGQAGSFLGEYQAGGTIVVLNLGTENSAPAGRFCGMGMYGGKIYLRGKVLVPDLSDRLVCRPATQQDMDAVAPALQAFCGLFGLQQASLYASPFHVLQPNGANPYRQLYTPL